MNRPQLMITGAGGFCGEHACEYFHLRGMEVTAVLRREPDEEDRRRLQHADHFEVCELTNEADVEALVARCKPDYILHLAGLNAAGPSWTSPLAYMDTNLMATLHLLEAVRSKGARTRILIAGSMLRFLLPASGEQPAPPHPYSVSKTMQVLAAQCWAVMYGVQAVIAEPSNLAGPGRSTGLCSLLARHTARTEYAVKAGHQLPSPFRLSSLTQRRDLLDVRDAMAAYELLLKEGETGVIYPIASGSFYTLGDIAEQFKTMSTAAVQVTVDEAAVPGASPKPVDTSAIRGLGWEPRIPFLRTLTDTLEDARQQLGGSSS
ncbi:NAD-dependent epimerase/dehydratase family protein [Paenibacillus sp. GCM10023252]|uniref:NAD-dependent epimerase/dehydratase family protein n=1 Tax=Paenibacillus sp. GCM10023252 TaxID=3252649 RepID=UPI003618D8E1